MDGVEVPAMPMLYNMSDDVTFLPCMARMNHRCRIEFCIKSIDKRQVLLVIQDVFVSE